MSTPPRPPARPPDPLLLRPSTVARLLGLSVKRVRFMLVRGEIPSRRLGGRYLVPRAELRAWLDGLPGVGATAALRAVARSALVAGLPPEVIETDPEGRKS